MRFAVGIRNEYRDYGEVGKALAGCLLPVRAGSRYPLYACCAQGTALGLVRGVIIPTPYGTKTTIPSRLEM